MSVLQNSLAIALFSGIAFLIAYRTYGRFLARRIFGFEADRETPAYSKRDGVDYVPTHPGVLFGHHFSSIAGLGPIVGPALALVWGWLPALLWVLFGSILIGAVHDLATLYAALRHDGRGLGDLTDEVIGPRARVLFLVIIFFLLALAMGVFALYMSQLFTTLCPRAVLPTFSLIFIAILIGVLVYVKRWRLGPVTAVGLLLMLFTLFVGMEYPVSTYELLISDAQLVERMEQAEVSDAAVDLSTPSQAIAWLAAQGRDESVVMEETAEVKQAGADAQSWWTYILLAYAFVASVLPVWLLLQPRDYINSYQLYLGVLAILLGLCVWHPGLNAPAIAPTRASELPILPFLFITIACGAISGFHSLVSSGTTVRQISSERHATAIGYGAMLTEGFLAVLVILVCGCGLSAEEVTKFYGSATPQGLGAFLAGAGTVISKPFLWISRMSDVSESSIVTFSKSFIAVVVISFAMTTLDSATRLLRYNVEAIGKVVHLPVLQNRYVASVVAVISIGFFALIKIDGKPAGVALWQLFGTTNQLLAAIGLLVVSVMLYKMRKPIVYTVIPMLFMVVSVAWAMSVKLPQFCSKGIEGGDKGCTALLVVGIALCVLTVWLLIEAVFAFRRYYRIRVAESGGR